jgi:hypothetical protein
MHRNTRKKLGDMTEYKDVGAKGYETVRDSDDVEMYYEHPNFPLGIDKSPRVSSYLLSFHSF